MWSYIRGLKIRPCELKNKPRLIFKPLPDEQTHELFKSIALQIRFSRKEFVYIEEKVHITLINS